MRVQHTGVVRSAPSSPHAATCDVQAVRVRWMGWGPPAGYTGNAGGWGRSCPR
uniref:Uncharacterized protein n=1 Tax=Siphoviridae sp. ctQqU1 TaxID=2825496 RepID=A0A8S5Q3F9_9CAUD|nr:MAG TPA: hypothetical protein [Siphoviridae sp. ctQqU1]